MTNVIEFPGLGISIVYQPVQSFNISREKKKRYEENRYQIERGFSTGINTKAIAQKKMFLKLRNRHKRLRFKCQRNRVVSRNKFQKKNEEEEEERNKKMFGCGRPMMLRIDYDCWLSTLTNYN